MPTFSEPVDFSKLEARNLVTHKLTAAPSSPVVGQRYFDTTLSKEGVYNGSSWNYTNTLTPIAGTIVNPVGASVVDFTIPAGVRRIALMTNDFAIPYGDLVRLGTSSGILATGYRSNKQYIGPGSIGSDVNTTVGLAVPRCAATTNTLMTFYRMSPNVWIFIGHSMEFSGGSQFASGNVSLPGELTTFRYISTATISSGSIQLLWEF